MNDYPVYVEGLPNGQARFTALQQADKLIEECNL